MAKPRPDPAATDPEVEGFLALLAARRAPKTVEAYRRDLRALGDWLGGPPSKATHDDLERWLAELRAAGLSPATIARRVAAVRSFFRHLVLLGARTDSPAAALELPRRRRKLPRTLSPAEAQRLIEAAAGSTPRMMRDRALVELLYGAGLRVSEAVGLDRTGIDLERRLIRCTGKGNKERVVPVGRHAVEALRRYLAHGRPYLDKRHRPELFLQRPGWGPHARGRVPDPAPPGRPVRASSRSASTRTCCAIRLPPICSRVGPTCAASRRCSGTPTSAPPSCTRTSPTGAAATSTSAATPTRGGETFRGRDEQE